MEMLLIGDRTHIKALREVIRVGVAAQLQSVHRCDSIEEKEFVLASVQAGQDMISLFDVTLDFNHVMEGM